jgi:hypothetical protein
MLLIQFIERARFVGGSLAHLTADLSLDFSRGGRKLKSDEHSVRIAATQCRPGFFEGLQHQLVRQFQVQVADWLDTCRALVDWEDEHLVEATSPERLAEHGVMLNDLERFGQWLAGAGAQLSNEAGSAVEQIKFALQDLRDSRAMWHGSASQERKREILRDCFHESWFGLKVQRERFSRLR